MSMGKHPVGQNCVARGVIKRFLFFFGQRGAYLRVGLGLSTYFYGSLNDSSHTKKR